MADETVYPSQPDSDGKSAEKRNRCLSALYAKAVYL